MLQVSSMVQPCLPSGSCFCLFRGEACPGSQLGKAGKHTSQLEHLGKPAQGNDSATCALKSFEELGSENTSIITDVCIVILMCLSNVISKNISTLNYQHDTKNLWDCTFIGSVNVFCLFFFHQERIQIYKGTLTIPMLNMSDSGLYQCVAENKYDTIYANAELRVIGE